MFDKLTSIETRYTELIGLVADPAVQADPSAYRSHAKALAELEPLVERFRAYKSAVQQLAQAEEMARSGEPDLVELAEEEIRTLESRRDELLAQIRILLIPRDPNDERNVMLEIRAGTGGDEAALFAAELFRMYTRYAERQGWRVEVMSASETGG
ncbi:MAG: PCRF domain-containing protein, partial [Acidobacteria bacterium]|nr:PCRF domain-containing protein [Acidobacteriota bacterium]